MSTESIIVAAIKATAPITALIGSSPTRLYPDTVLQGSVLPAMAYQRISTPRVTNIKGESNLARVRIQLTIHASNPTAREQTFNAVKAAFNGYTDKANGIDRILVSDGRYTYEPTTKTYACTVDLIVWAYE